MKFVLASHNKKKLVELGDILGTMGITIASLPAEAPEPVEDGQTFEDNARIKARSAMVATGMPAIADDSGLCVEALHGAPGVFSARYGSEEYCARFGAVAGGPLKPNAEDAARTQLLLRNMETVPEGARQASFVCAIACVFPDGREFVTRGACTGEITREVQGEGGFGYDPVFFVPEHSCTFGQLSPEIKNKISHRANALKEFIKIMKAYIEE